MEVTVIQLWQIGALLAVHYVGDFILQTHWQASNKGKLLEALFRHVAVYTFALLVGSKIIFGDGYEVGWFALTNGVAHFATDYFTSRWSSVYFGRAMAARDAEKDGYYLNAKQRRLFGLRRVTVKVGDAMHDFFVVIGFDQFLHQATLLLLLWALL